MSACPCGPSRHRLVRLRRSGTQVLARQGCQSGSDRVACLFEVFILLFVVPVEHGIEVCEDVQGASFRHVPVAIGATAEEHARGAAVGAGAVLDKAEAIGDNLGEPFEGHPRDAYPARGRTNQPASQLTNQPTTSRPRRRARRRPTSPARAPLLSGPDASPRVQERRK